MFDARHGSSLSEDVYGSSGPLHNVKHHCTQHCGSDPPGSGQNPNFAYSCPIVSQDITVFWLLLFLKFGQNQVSNYKDIVYDVYVFVSVVIVIVAVIFVIVFVV